MATVYLHIGLPKTGTTAIQNFLMQNREALLAHGLCYPDFGYRYLHVGNGRNGHFLAHSAFSYGGENNQSLSEFPGKQYEEGLNKVAALSEIYDKIVLTDEVICRSIQLHPGFWSYLKEDLEKRNLNLRIIVYLRRQDLWASSHWTQRVKIGKTALSFSDHISFLKETNYPLDYCAYMDMLSGIFGRDALIIRVYEKGQFQGEQHTLISDFLAVFGLSLSDGFSMEKEFYNLSLHGNYTEIQRIFNTIPDFYDNDHILKKSVRNSQNLYLKPDEPDYYTWRSPEEQCAFLASFAGSNEAVARKYLHREDGQLFYDPVEVFPDREPDEQALTRDMLYVYAHSTYLLEQENNTLRKELDRLNTQLNTQIECLKKYVPLYHLKRAIWHILGKDKPSNGKN